MKHGVVGLFFISAVVVGTLWVSNAHNSAVQQQTIFEKYARQKVAEAVHAAKDTASRVQAEAKHQCSLQYAYYNNLPPAVRKTVAPPGCPR